ncbi:pin domain protein [Heliomicrobium modesticaldum Ice1]|uniref:Pin domain protein n=1 Tax=Heliobacterium modesticaldum (strain ATCC 51547 / Ice1) TaxID=498761 RepID=B0TBU1_HELMI|nr:PIN/TRAM domain-containing protein [Heliomicrobium modesticaldum]ABZ83930.1 pin domain protein [Heliomicrobium modesticaldum Ice1]
MIHKFMRSAIAVAFAAVGFSSGMSLLSGANRVFDLSSYPAKHSFLAVITLIPGALGFIIAPQLIRWVVVMTGWLENRLQRTPIQDLVGGAIGLIVGLIIANLLDVSISELPGLGRYLSVGLSAIMGYVGMRVGVKKREEILTFIYPRWKEKHAKDKLGDKAEARGACLKVLDTSVIIDGRIADICKSGFIDGTLVIPAFVLEELQHIADSSDLLKRNRGRRGLDVLNKIRKELDVAVQIDQRDYDDLAEVDSKLVRLCREINGHIVTNDYNLNKVAELQGVKVLNINELANAVKPVVLPGEEMTVQVIKDGKELGQGVAYLDDGTMIVVDGGKRFIGQTITVLVTSVLQTSAGRMIFAKPKIGEGKKVSPTPALNEVNAIV